MHPLSHQVVMHHDAPYHHFNLSFKFSLTWFLYIPRSFFFTRQYFLKFFLQFSLNCENLKTRACRSGKISSHHTLTPWSNTVLSIESFGLDSVQSVFIHCSYTSTLEYGPHTSSSLVSLFSLNNASWPTELFRLCVHTAWSKPYEFNKEADFKTQPRNIAKKHIW